MEGEFVGGGRAERAPVVAGRRGRFRYLARDWLAALGSERHDPAGQ